MATRDAPAIPDFRLLWRRGLCSLAAVAALLVAFQGTVAVLLAQQASSAALLNRAGRQRMLCERITKAILAAELAPTAPERAVHLAEARTARAQWDAAQRWLQQAEGVPGVGQQNSPEAAAALRSLAIPAAALARTLDPGAPWPPALADLLAQEHAFVSGMDALVALYEHEAHARVQRLVALDCLLGLLVVLALAMLTLLVLRPALERLRLAVAERDRLQAQEARMRELAVASDVARSIGEDLHDGVGQALTALSLAATSLGRVLAAHPAQEQAQAMASAARAALVQVRAAASRLSPPELETAGVCGALARLADDVGTATGVACEVTCTLEPPRGGEDLYRIAQEAVANAVRHGQARRIVIALRADGAQGELVIRDDGVGGPASSAPHAGLGLRSMHHRAERLGGSLDAGPCRDGGWRVRCTFPLTTSAA